MELYYGHDGKKVIDAHYTHLEDDELIEIFRREVVEKVDQVASSYLSIWRTESQKVVQLNHIKGHLGNVWVTKADAETGKMKKNQQIWWS